MAVQAGDTFFIAKSEGQIPHLWIAVTEPDGDPATLVIVSLTTKRPGSDPTLVLGPGDHPFVRHETVVMFADARLVRASHLSDLLATRPDWRRQPCCADLLGRIQAGLLASPYTPNDIKAFCRGRR